MSLRRTLWVLASVAIIFAVARLRSNRQREAEVCAGAKVLETPVPDILLGSNLAEVMEQLRGATGAQIALDRELDNAHVELASHNIDLSIHGLTLGRALDYSLANPNPQLTYTTAGDRILIIRNPELREEVRVYDVRDIVRSARATGYRRPTAYPNNLSAGPSMPDVADDGKYWIS
jgi:hypothetical protein